MMDSARKLIESAIDKVGGAYLGAIAGADHVHDMDIAHKEIEEIKSRALESVADLQLSIDDVGWVALGEGLTERLVNRGTLTQVVRLSRIMYLLNPLIRRAVTVQELYVWGSGCTIKSDSKSKELQQVLDDFFNDPKNQCAVGSSWAEREREQRNDGNVFFCMYRNRVNGTARVRTIPMDEIQDIIHNPEDRNEPWFYVRGTGSGKVVLYPDVNYTPAVRPELDTIGQRRIDWDVAVIHVKTGGLPGMKFGLPEFYSVFNWATAYKGILENFATILKAYARIAWKLTGQKSEKGVAASKTKLQTTVNPDNAIEKNPPNNTAGWAIFAGNADLSAVKTANSTTGPDEARALRSMVAAGTDTPEHFFGDSDIGNFATSTTLDRPTELKMIARQKMWADVIAVMVRVLIEWSTVAPRGVLNDAGYTYKRTRDRFDGTWVIAVTAPSGKSTKVKVKFPAILERNVTDRVRAVVQAGTLGGRPAEGIIPDRKVLARMLLEALGEKDAEELTDILYPESVMQGFQDPAQSAENEKMEAEAKMTQAKALQKQSEQPTVTPKPAT